MPSDADDALKVARRWLTEALATAQRRQAQLAQAQAEVEAATEALLMAEIAVNLCPDTGDDG